MALVLSIEAMREPIDRGVSRPLAWRLEQLDRLAAAGVITGYAVITVSGRTWPRSLALAFETRSTAAAPLPLPPAPQNSGALEAAGGTFEPELSYDKVGAAARPG
jgi:hypothetical protein